MLLIFITALISFHAKRFYTVPVFAIASHIILGIFYSFNSIGGNDQYIGVLISALISLVIGSVLYGWTLWYKRKHDIDDTKRIRRRVTKILGALILVVGLLNIWIIYQGIESGKRLVENARFKVAADTQNIKEQKAESIIVPHVYGLGNPIDTRLWNPDGSVSQYAKDQQEHAAKVAWGNARDTAILQAVNSGITLFPVKAVNESLLALGGASKALVDSAIIVMSSTFGLAEALAIKMGTPDDQSFDPKTRMQDINDLPSYYQTSLMGASSSAEFDALEAQVREVLADQEILQGAGREISPYIEGFLEAVAVIISLFLFLKLMDVIRRIQAWKREAEARLAVEREEAAAKRSEAGEIQPTKEEKVLESNQPSGFDLFFADTKRLMSFDLPWSERTTLEKSYTVIFAIMLVGLLPMPYEFYDNLRVVVCLCLYFYFQAILPERKQRRGWFVAIIGLLILYNPVAPIHIGDQAVWSLINASVIYSLYRARLIFDTAKSKETPENSDPDSYMNTEQSVEQ